MAETQFRLFVSSVPGRLVSRPGNPHAYIGAKLRTPDEVKAGITEPTWQPEVITPVLEAEYLRFSREWDALIRGDDLIARTESDFVAYQKAQADAEAKRDAELAKAAKKSGEKPAPEQAQPQGGA
jgi:hypothetical protein